MSFFIVVMVEFDGCWGRSLNVLSPASMVSGKPLLVETVRSTGRLWSSWMSTMSMMSDMDGYWVGYGWMWLDILGYIDILGYG